MLGLDPDDIAFNIYRDGQLLNGTPITDSTNYVDSAGSTSGSYEVRAIIDGEEQDGESTAPWQGSYMTVDLDRPSTSHSPNDASVADLDGDGQYEIILKWYPNNAKDNSQSGYTDNVYLDAYEFSGERLWRIDLGRNIRAGAHYTQFMVYDFDGDGKAELAAKTGDGTRDAMGTIIGNANADHRNGDGYILTGPEYFSVFNGETGAVMDTIDYPNERGNLASWGDTYGNRVDRFLAGVAYLDGKRPSIIHARGYYGDSRTLISAIDWRDGELTTRWNFGADGSTNTPYRGEGAHSLSIADVDGDGRDEIIYGAATIDDNGRGLYATGLGHGDALHVADIIPSRPGLEVFMVHESPRDYGDHGVEVHDARTGEILYSGDGGGSDVGRGVTADIDPRHPGMESWGSSNGLFTSAGQELSAKPRSMNFLAWWDGDLLRELLDGTTLSKWDYQGGRTNTLLNGGSNGARSSNGTKATPTLSGDIFGDWREEIIWHNENNRQLMVYTTNIPTEHRLRTLMHDPQYRVAIAWQNVAYNQPPHPSFFLGDGMETPPKPDIHYADGNYIEPVTLRVQENSDGQCSVDGVFEDTNAGFTGSGYLNSDNELGATISWSVNAAAAGEYRVNFRYASASDRPADLLVNDSQQNLAFAASGDWTLWYNISAVVELEEGQNQIVLRAQDAEGLANIDYLEIVDDGVSAGSCP